VVAWRFTGRRAEDCSERERGVAGCFAPAHRSCIFLIDIFCSVPCRCVRLKLE
jgi:hypothetical protein